MTEHQEQCAYFRWVAYAYPKKLIFAIPNGGNREAKTGAMMKREGVKAGIPDIMVASANGVYHGLFIEMKAAKGRLSESQKAVMEQLLGEGYLIEVCRSWQEAKEITEKYLK
jgi:hypothetical protein